MRRATRRQPLARAVLRTQSDERLVALSREGRDAAFEEIVRRYRPGLVAFAGAYAPSDRAEDVVQESLLRSWDALQSSASEIRLKPWLYTIVRNRALNARRDARVHQPLDETIDGVRQPSEIALTHDELGRVVAAVKALPEPQREALVRSALEGHTHEQIATALETSPGAVRQLIYRARGTLRDGFGLILPLPLVAALSGGGSGSAAAAAAGAIGSAGGGSLAAKGATVVAVGAIAVGGGVAIERSIGGKGDDPRASEAQQSANEARDPSAGASLAANDPQARGSGSGLAPAGDGDLGGALDRGDGNRGEDRRAGTDGHEQGDDESGGEGSGGPSPDSGQSDADNDAFEADESDEGSGEGGGGSGGSGTGSSESGSSGSGSGGHTSGESGSSGSGSGSGSDSGGAAGSDSSGPGSSGSGSGSGSDGSGSGSGSSGSGSDAPPEPPGGDSSGSDSGEEPEQHD